MNDRTKDPMCADCGGWDIEWMYQCSKHKVEYCRGCCCPECADDEANEDYDSESDYL